MLGLEVAATAGLIWWAGPDKIVHALSLSNTEWFALCAAGQLIAYLGYGWRSGDGGSRNGVELSLPTSLAVVSVGFGPMFSANTSGGFSVDYLTLRHAGMSKKRATRRVLGLSALEYAVLAPAVAVCGVLLVLGLGGSAPAKRGPAVAGGRSRERSSPRGSPRRSAGIASSPTAGDGWLRRGFAHVVGALGVLRALVADWRDHGTAFGGAALYWFGDILTFWAALRVFDISLSVAVLVLVYGTGWALTRRSLPFGGPGWWRSCSPGCSPGSMSTSQRPRPACSPTGCSTSGSR